MSKKTDKKRPSISIEEFKKREAQKERNQPEKSNEPKPKN